MKNTISTLALVIGAIKDTNGDIIEIYAPILAGIIDDYHNMNSLESTDIADAIEEIENKFSDDFTFEFDGNEYRIINDASIWEIYVDTIKDIVEDCYDLNLDKIPSFISVSIDWEQTAHNARADGYGHTFSSYDGSELLVNNHWVFRTN